MNFQINQTNRYRVIGGWKVGYILGGLDFLAALQPYKWLVCIKIYRPFSWAIPNFQTCNFQTYQFSNNLVVKKLVIYSQRHFFTWIA